MVDVLTFVALMIILKLLLSRFKVSWKELLKNSVILFVLLTIFFSILKPEQLEDIAFIVLLIGSVINFRQMIVYDVEMIEIVLRLGIMICLILSLTTDSGIFLPVLSVLSVPWIFYLFKHKKTSENLILCIENSAKVSRKGCKWGSKPVVVEGDFKNRTVIGAKGILIITRRDKALVLVKRSAHEKLGSLCLEEFVKNLLRCLYHRE